MTREPNEGIRMPTFRTTTDDNTSRRRLPQGVLRRVRTINIHSGALAAIDYIAEVYLPSAKTETQPSGDVEQTLREAIGYEPTE